jgi:hypothetical protein
MLSIDLGRLIGTELSNLVNVITEIIVLLYTALRPAIKVLAMLFSLLVDAVRAVVKAITWAVVEILNVVAMLVRAVGSLLNWMSNYIPGQIGAILGAVGTAAGGIATAISAYAKSIQQSANVGQNAVAQMNAAFIKGISDVGKMAYSGVTAPGPNDERQAPTFNAPLKVDSHGNVRTHRGGGSQSAAAGRSAVSVQPPQLASVVNNVQLKAEIKLQHEEAVQRAIEEVRGCLVKAIHQVRNEQLSLSSRIYAKTVVDL